MAGLSYERRPPHYTDEPEPYNAAALWRGVLIAIPMSIAAWSILIGLGYLGYRVGQMI